MTDAKFVRELMDIKMVATAYLEQERIKSFYHGYLKKPDFPLHTAHIDAWHRHLERLEDEKQAQKAAERKAAREELLKNAWPMEKQRRSRVDWHEILPKEWAENQIRWERGKTAHEMRKSGMTLNEIGKCFGVSGSRVAGIEIIYIRMSTWRHFHGKSPAERFMEQPYTFGDVRRSSLPIVNFYLSQFSRYTSGRDWLFVASR